MSLRILQSLCRLGLLFPALMAVCTVALAQGTAGSPGRSIEFSPPVQSTLTNVSLFPRTSPELLDHLSGTSGDVNLTGNSAVRTTRPSPVTPGRRSAEQLDDERNWMFLSPEEAMRNFALDQVLKTTGVETRDRDIETGSAIERFYQRLARPAASTNSNLTAGDVFGRDNLAGDPTERDPVVQAYTPWNTLWSQNPWESAPPREDSLFSTERNPVDLDLAGLIAPRATPEQIRAREGLETQLREFRKLLNLPSESSGLLAPSTASSGASSLPAPGAGLPPIGSGLQLQGADPGPTIPTGPALPSLPNQPTQYGQSSLAPMLQYNQPRITPMPQLNYSPPKRAF